jgi:hypothetical protein
MTQQPSRVIYLPPGVVAPQGPSSPAVPANPGIPFDKAFFQQILPAAVDGFCQQVGCNVPILEVLTVDGMTHYVNGIIGVADQWLRSRSQAGPRARDQMFVPYRRYSAWSSSRAGRRRRHLGFAASGDKPTTVRRWNRSSPGKALVHAPGRRNNRTLVLAAPVSVTIP